MKSNFLFFFLHFFETPYPRWWSRDIICVTRDRGGRVPLLFLRAERLNKTAAVEEVNKLHGILKQDCARDGWREDRGGRQHMSAALDSAESRQFSFQCYRDRRAVYRDGRITRPSPLVFFRRFSNDKFYIIYLSFFKHSRFKPRESYFQIKKKKQV